LPSCRSMRRMLHSTAVTPPSENEPPSMAGKHPGGAAGLRQDADAVNEDTEVLLRPAGISPSDPGVHPDRTSPVFVDASGRRRMLLRCCGALLAVGCVGFAALLGMSVVGGALAAPHVSIPAGGTSGQAASVYRALPLRPPTAGARRHSAASPGHPATSHASRHASSRASSHTPTSRTSRTV